jgi:NADH:ubiquinone oxidoreductase subunit 5 (subunit L)/multisubunit Na+/H+ antiporter MnhA subunit
MIGLTSFFLINFYNLKSGVFKSSFKAFYFNKISDGFILVGSILMIRDGIDFVYILPGNINLLDSMNNGVYFIYFGASVKSSQIGFHF